MAMRYLTRDSEPGPDPADFPHERRSCPDCESESVSIVLWAGMPGIVCDDCGARPEMVKSEHFEWTAGLDGDWVAEPIPDFELEESPW